LDKVERYVNDGVVVSNWLGIQVFESERAKNGEVVWHYRSPPANLTNILTIGVFKEHAFLIKDIAKLEKLMNARIFIKDSHKQTIFNGIPKHAAKEKQ